MCRALQESNETWFASACAVNSIWKNQQYWNQKLESVITRWYRNGHGLEMTMERFKCSVQLAYLITCGWLGIFLRSFFSSLPSTRESHISAISSSLYFFFSVDWNQSCVSVVLFSCDKLFICAHFPVCEVENMNQRYSLFFSLVFKWRTTNVINIVNSIFMGFSNPSWDEFQVTLATLLKPNVTFDWKQWQKLKDGWQKV